MNGVKPHNLIILKQIKKHLKVFWTFRLLLYCDKKLEDLKIHIYAI